MLPLVFVLIDYTNNQSKEPSYHTKMRFLPVTLAAGALLSQLVDGVYRGNASSRPAQRAAAEHSQDILEMFAAQLDREQHRPDQPNQRPQRPNNNEEEREEERDDDSEGRANEDPEARVHVPNQGVPNQGREVISLPSENYASSSESSTASTNNTAASSDSEERLNQISHSGRNIFLDSSDDDSEDESVICPANNDNSTIAASSTTMSAKNNTATSNDSDKESAIQGNVTAINENDNTTASSTMSANVANNNTQRIQLHVRMVSLSPPTIPTVGEDPSNVDQSTTTHHPLSSSTAGEGGTASCDGGDETSNQSIAAPSNDGTSMANNDSSRDTGGTAFHEINYERIRSLITGEEGEEDLGDVDDRVSLPLPLSNCQVLWLLLILIFNCLIMFIAFLPHREHLSLWNSFNFKVSLLDRGKQAWEVIALLVQQLTLLPNSTKGLAPRKTSC